jgi:hypothetical protein
VRNLTVAWRGRHNASVTTTHSTARQTMLAQITLPPEVMARRWEPLSPELAEVLRDWSRSGELARTLQNMGDESDSLDD